MTKRSGGFVEKIFYTIIAYTHGNISLSKILCQFAHIPWNLIVSIGREYTADPVDNPIISGSVARNVIESYLISNREVRWLQSELTSKSFSEMMFKLANAMTVAYFVYLLVCHAPFIANGAVRILHRAINHMTDQHIYFLG